MTTEPKIDKVMSDMIGNNDNETLPTGREPHEGRWWMELWNSMQDYFMYEPVEEDDFFKNMRWYRNENMKLTKKDR